VEYEGGKVARSVKLSVRGMRSRVEIARMAIRMNITCTDVQTWT